MNHFIIFVIFVQKMKIKNIRKQSARLQRERGSLEANKFVLFFHTGTILRFECSTRGKQIYVGVF